MSETKDDGGPAFPRPAAEHSQGGHFEQSGMSLRDWFAGQALSGIAAGLCANTATLPGEPCFERAMGRFVFDSATQDAYRIADAMLAARSAP